MRPMVLCISICAFESTFSQFASPLSDCILHLSTANKYLNACPIDQKKSAWLLDSADHEFDHPRCRVSSIQAQHLLKSERQGRAQRALRRAVRTLEAEIA
mmetsp:Transcript_23543/g.58442  ORF Transcript_23543/g.58442 Transcript_23543/m.58442 type:complete len:100 (+) Transcript_23543:290-589(+)